MLTFLTEFLWYYGVEGTAEVQKEGASAAVGTVKMSEGEI